MVKDGKKDNNRGKTTSQDDLEPGDHSIDGRKSENINNVQVSHKLNRRTNFALKWVLNSVMKLSI